MAKGNVAAYMDADSYEYLAACLSDLIFSFRIIAKFIWNQLRSHNDTSKLHLAKRKTIASPSAVQRGLMS